MLDDLSFLQNVDIVLLDDVLSAVDAHVGKNILENCLTKGPLANRTRILATHALSALARVDHIYVLEKGEIVEHGTYHVGFTFRLFCLFLIPFLGSS